MFRERLKNSWSLALRLSLVLGAVVISSAPCSAHDSDSIEGINQGMLTFKASAQLDSPVDAYIYSTDEIAVTSATSHYVSVSGLNATGSVNVTYMLGTWLGNAQSGLFIDDNAFADLSQEGYWELRAEFSVIHYDMMEGDYFSEAAARIGPNAETVAYTYHTHLLTVDL